MTVVVLMFETDLCGVWHMAYIFPDIIQNFFVCQNRFLPNLPRCFFINQTVFDNTWSEILTDF